jgi:hypothetical protein
MVNKVLHSQFGWLALSRLVLAVTLALDLALLFELGKLAFEKDLLNRSNLLILAFGIGIILSLLTAIVLIGLFAGTWKAPQRVYMLGQRLLSIFRRLGKLNWLVFGLLILAFSILIIWMPHLSATRLGSYTRFLSGFIFRLLPFWLIVVAGTILLRAGGLQQSWGTLLAGSFLFTAAVFRLIAFIPEVSTSAFSLGWSEASRYYYASLYFSKQLYGIQIPPTVLHPSRYLMQSVPFLIPDSPLWLHRAWQVVLWLAVTLATSLLLARRLAIKDRFIRWLFVLWAGLFLLMPPVYYHLQVPIILVLLGFNRHKSLQTWMVVLLASLWAGISRVNWFSVPGMLAATLYFLEEPVSVVTSRRRILSYLLNPVAWVAVGILVAFGSQAGYALWSGNPTEQFSSSFSSDLLWYRLFPNATFPLGILLSAFLVILPLVLILLGDLKQSWREYHPIRTLGIAGILTVLFLGGIVVSVKIGGGSNLHNLDAFLVLLLVATSYVFFGKVASETKDKSFASHHQPSWLVVAWALAVPIIFTLNSGAIEPPPNQAQVTQAINTIQEAVDQADGQVLFISERQLSFFDQITGTPLTHDYEKVFLMEMAMANNRPYLEKFYADLKNHRFALIVSEPLKAIYQDRSDSFGEENNAWVDRVVKPILCYYEPVKTMKDMRTQILAPLSRTDNASALPPCP